MERPQLLDQLAHSHRPRLVLITASAGYGKSTLMAQWHQLLLNRGEQVGWLTLDEDDNDPTRLYTYLYYVLVQEPLEEESGSHITRAQIEMLASRCRSPQALFIDELEFLHDPEALQLLEWLYQLLPPGNTLIIAGRNKPEWELAKLKLQGGLLELDDQSLRLTPSEAAGVKELSVSRGIDDRLATRLVEKTEGWMAGIRLALLCLNRVEDADDWVEQLSGEMSEIATFLAEEMFRHLAIEEQLFLLKTAVAKSLCAPLCEELTQQADAQTQLESFCRRGLFIQPIDREHRWFRVHNLVRQFLLNRLQQQMPQQLSPLHTRAAHWYAAHDSRVEAVHHALAVNNTPLASEILASIGHSLVKRGQLHTLTDLAAPIPELDLAEYPELLTNIGWALLLLHRREEAARYVHQLRKLQHDSAMQAIADFPGLEPLLLVVDDRVEEAQQLATRNIEQLPPKSWFARGVLANIIAYASVTESQFERARQFQLEARASHLQSGSLFGLAYADMMAAMSERCQGHLHSAQERFARIGLGPEYGRPAESTQPAEVAKGVINGVEVDLLYELNQRDSAESLLNHYFPLGEDAVAPDMVILGYLTLARLAFAQGNVPRAFDRLEEGEVAGLRWPLPRLVQSMRWQRVQFALQQGQQAQAHTLAEQASANELQIPSSLYLNLVDDWAGIDLIPLRLQAQLGEGQQVLTELQRLLTLAEKRPCRRLRLLALQGHTELLLGEQGAADTTLTAAIDLSLKTGAIRTLIDEGETVLAALTRLHHQWQKPDVLHQRRRDYCRGLLDAAGQPLASGRESPEALFEPLTDRELQLLTLVSQGLKNDQIAEQIYLSVNTVKWHLRRAYEKLEVKSRTEALAAARKHGLID